MEGRIDMDILEKIGETISDKGKVAVDMAKEAVDKAKDKTKEFTEIARLKSQIGTCEDVIRRNYMEIGRLYYEEHGSAPEAQYAKVRRYIENAQKGVEELQEKMNEIKGV